MHQAVFEDKTCYVQSGTTFLSRTFWDLHQLLNLITSKYSESQEQYTKLEIAKMICTLYAATGCDFNPFIKSLTKSAIFSMNETVNKSSVLASKDDFLRVVAESYEAKKKSVLFSPKLADAAKDISRLRNDLFHLQDKEEANCPLASSLCLQYTRAVIIMKYWFGEDVSINEMKENGWEEVNGRVKMKLYDSNDPLYRDPRELIKGCGCTKRPCTKCHCIYRRGCSKVTCKKCPCVVVPSENTEIPSSDNGSDDEIDDFLNNISDSDSSDDDGDNIDEIDEVTFDLLSDYSDDDET